MVQIKSWSINTVVGLHSQASRRRGGFPGQSTGLAESTKTGLTQPADHMAPFALISISARLANSITEVWDIWLG